MNTTETPHRTAAEHLARAESLIAECERRQRTHAMSYEQTATLAALHMQAADTMAQLQIAEKHVELADVLTAYSIDAQDIEDKDHGPESWPPLTT